MTRAIYLTVACDADPDFNPSVRQLPGDARAKMWQGIEAGIPALRRRLKDCRFCKEYGGLPITWLLRSDRQILELFGDAAYCFREFEPIWKDEQKLGSEIGWHPHLHRWSDVERDWKPHLNQDDDLEVLSECLSSLRQSIDIRAVRTGWDYHSNNLMRFFDRQGISVDASALPGCVNSRTEVGCYNWVGTPRLPYHPSRVDYRRPARGTEGSLTILEAPMLVRRLGSLLHLGRYFLRAGRALRHWKVELADWENSRWQGMRLTFDQRTFRQAFKQSLPDWGERDFMTFAVYFHTGDLLNADDAGQLAQNLDVILGLAESFGFQVIPSTMSALQSFEVTA